MPASNIAPNLGIKVVLGGVERRVRFTMSSIRWLAEKYGNVMEAFGIFQRISTDPTALLSVDCLDALADIVTAGLIADDPDMTPKYVMDNFQTYEIAEILTPLVGEFMKSVQSQPIRPADKKKAGRPSKIGPGNDSTP